MRGRKKLPRALKALKGTLQPCRDNKNEPQPGISKQVPKPPKHIHGEARKLWLDLAPKLHECGLLTQADTIAFSLLCEAHQIYRDARDIVEKEGMVITVKDSRGVTVQKVHPAYRIESQWQQNFLKMAVEFGLTPASRGRINVKPLTPEDDNPFTKLDGGKK